MERINFRSSVIFRPRRLHGFTAAGHELSHGATSRGTGCHRDVTHATERRCEGFGYRNNARYQRRHTARGGGRRAQRPRPPLQASPAPSLGRASGAEGLRLQHHPGRAPRHPECHRGFPLPACAQAPIGSRDAGGGSPRIWRGADPSLGSAHRRGGKYGRGREGGGGRHRDGGGGGGGRGRRRGRLRRR